MNGKDGVVKLLLEREDVDVNLQDEEGRTPLSRAKMEGHRGVAKLLSERASTAPDHTTRTTR
ncbi:hypothetical protein FN846DRAFT_956834 [Sphaerosporella brunnea]|uniref:Uncharacterized protein n=1 Tax=Sphaerosporella brunnea TaxID=1250544 RepID=A0A5J5ES67_9PEZI|nr:hypothetical protein FN846DRAFT_956834 [Sphaerosporella brunnea]